MDSRPGELSRTFKLTTLWLVLGALVFVGVQAGLAQRDRARFSVESQSGAIELRRSADGHFHWPGRVNGLAVDFLVDTGASTTALPQLLAKRAGLPDEGRLQVSTAGGSVVGMRSRADVELQGGVRAERLRVAVLPQLDAPLLGMDVLSRMRFSQGDGILRFEPPQ